MPENMPKSFSDISKRDMRGLIRAVDNIGRMTIPCEYRQELGIGAYDEVEIFILTDGVYIRKVNREKGRR